MSNFKLGVVSSYTISYGMTLPSGTIILHDTDCRQVYVCRKFPNYKGKKVPTLELFVYDEEFQNWDKFWDFDGIISSKIWSHHLKIGGETVNSVNFMKHERVHKHGSGGTRENVHAITDYSCSNKVDFCDITNCRKHL